MFLEFAYLLFFLDSTGKVTFNQVHKRQEIRPLMDNKFLQIININRDAIAVNRGFYYQYLNVLKKWVDNFIAGNNKIVQTEVGDDIKEIGDQLVFTQVKCYSSTFNLKSREIRKALFNFFFLYIQEKETIPEIQFAFETNTSVSPNEKLLKRWIDGQSDLKGELLGLVNNKLTEMLLSELKKNREAKLQSGRGAEDKKQSLKEAYTQFAKEINVVNIQEFATRIKWNFGDQSPENAIHTIYKEIRNKLQNDKFQSHSASMLLDVLLSEIYRCSQLEDKTERFLDNAKLSAILDYKHEDLEPYVNQRFIDLLGGRFNALQHAIEDLQKDQIQTKQQIEDLHSIVLDKKLPKYINAIPSVYPDTVFGRQDDIEDVLKLINEKKQISIVGIGGMGKTTLAKAFINEYEENYDHIIWINGQTDLVTTFIADTNLSIHFPSRESNLEPATKRFDRILSFLNEIEGQNLIIINDFKEDYDNLSKIRNLRNWQVMITTRSHSSGIPTYKLRSLQYDTAKQLYRKHEPQRQASDESLEDLFNRIGYNTMVIEVVAKTIHNSLDLDVLGFIEYLKGQQLDDGDLEIDISDDDQKETLRLFSVLQNTFNISGLSDFDQHYLEFFSLLPSEGTKISELIEWYGKDHERQNKVQFPNIINSLSKKGWIERDGDNLFMHKMLQESITYEARKGINPFMGQFMQICWLGRRLNEGIHNDPAKAVRFLKYGESILEVIKEPYRSSVYQPLLIIENEVLNVYNWLLVKHDTVARWKDLLKRVEKSLPVDYDDLLGTIYNNYALALTGNKKMTEAIPYFEKAIEILRKYGEKTVISLLYSLNNLSQLYSETGELEKFKLTFEQATKVRKQYNLFNDQSFAVQCNLMGIANQNIGNYSTAVTYFKMAVKSQYEVAENKRNDLNLVLFLNNLAYNFMRLGEKDVAIGVVNKALTELAKLDIHNNRVLPELVTTLIFILKELGEDEKALQMDETLKDILNGNN